jgi:hypothetical protein
MRRAAASDRATRTNESGSFNATLDDALTGQVGDRRLARGEQQIGQPVGDEPVDLLRHPAAARSEPGLDVGDRDPELRRGQGAGEGAVRVAVDQDGIGRQLR